MTLQAQLNAQGVLSANPKPDGRVAIPFQVYATNDPSQINQGFSYLIDITPFKQNNIFNEIKAVAIDNSRNSAPIVFQVPGSIKLWTWPANAVGVLSLQIGAYTQLLVSSNGVAGVGATSQFPVYFEFLNWGEPGWISAPEILGIDGLNIVSLGNPLPVTEGDAQLVWSNQSTVAPSQGPSNNNTALVAATTVFISNPTAIATGYRFRNIGDGNKNFPDAYYNTGDSANGAKGIFAYNPATQHGGDHLLQANAQWETLPYRMGSTGKLLSFWCAAATNIEVDTY